MRTQIELYGKKYIVRTANILSPELSPVSGQTHYGVVNFSTNEIVIADSLSNERFMQTIRHEIAHAVFNFTCQDLEHYTEEKVCDIIGIHCGTIQLLAEQVFEEWKPFKINID